MRVIHLVSVVLLIALTPVRVYANETNGTTTSFATKKTERSLKSLRRRTQEKEESFLGKVGGFFENVAYTLKTMVTGTDTDFDIIIIGAGAAGLAAATEILALAPDVSFVILESTDRVGGRVRSTKIGAEGHEVVVEDGANWIYPVFRNKFFEIAEEIGLQKFLQDYYNFTAYNESVSTSVFASFRFFFYTILIKAFTYDYSGDHD